MQQCDPQFNTIYSTMLHCIAQYSAAQYSVLQDSNAQSITTQITTQHYTSRHTTVLLCPHPYLDLSEQGPQ